ncbi:c-type cytochrome [Lentisalinibacter salinarum]|uniref:c-type cytochrome n=1 Tax=Lentisalinibacter salinarum TaxID=2992239 RepID=UPI00386A86E6
MRRAGSRNRTVAPAILLLLLAGCGAGPDSADRQPAVTAAELGDQTVLSADEYLAQPTYAGADLERGRSLYLQCRACHTIEEGGSNLAGPNLHGIFGSRAAAVEDFPYSEALRQADFIWTPRAMDAWITNPWQFLPGNRMSYGGMRRPEDRRDLIAWMLRASDE